MMIFLGPMAGFTDSSFRDICTKQGATNTTTEMVSAMGYLNAPKNGVAYLHLLQTSPSESNVSAQIFGSDPDVCTKAALAIAGMGSFSYIDVNMGCPVKKIVGNGEGSALMKTPEKAAAIVKKLSRVLSLPISVKFRLGWDAFHINATEFGKIMENSGAKMLCLHARTREQFYQGNADWDAIARLKQSVSIPVIASGDIKNGQDAINIIKHTNCDGIMVARAALGNPWVFSEIKHVLNGQSYTPPSIKDRFEMASYHFNSIVQNKGETIGVSEAKTQIGHYFNGISNAAIARRKLNYAKNKEDMQNIINEVFQNLI